MEKQRGLSLIGMLIVSAILIVLALVTFKLLPSYIEYFTIKRVVSDIATSPDMRGASVRDVINAFDRRATIDDITAIRGTDLSIAKVGSGFTIGAAYAVRVPIVGNVSACIDFETEASSQ